MACNLRTIMIYTGTEDLLSVCCGTDLIVSVLVEKKEKKNKTADKSQLMSKI